jgi:hypothetical protein
MNDYSESKESAHNRPLAVNFARAMYWVVSTGPEQS